METEGCGLEGIKNLTQPIKPDFIIINDSEHSQFQFETEINIFKNYSLKDLIKERVLQLDQNENVKQLLESMVNLKK